MQYVFYMLTTSATDTFMAKQWRHCSPDILTPYKYIINLYPASDLTPKKTRSWYQEGRLQRGYAYKRHALENRSCSSAVVYIKVCALIFQNSLWEESCRMLARNITYPQTFSMYKDLGYRSTSNIDIFNLLWSNVFSLCKFKYILLPVNDLQCSILEVKGGCHQFQVPVSLLQAAEYNVLLFFFSK